MSTNSMQFLLYHIIFSVHNRDKRLHEALRLRMFPYIGGIIKNIGGSPLIVNGTSDHVHILAFLPRHISIAESVKIIKAKSSLWHNRSFDKNNHPLHWQEGYGIFTVGADSLEAVKNYIAEQSLHHDGRSFNEEWKAFADRLAGYESKFTAMDCPAIDD